MEEERRSGGGVGGGGAPHELVLPIGRYEGDGVLGLELGELHTLGAGVRDPV